MKKYPSIDHAKDKPSILEGSNIVVLEKIDCANSRFCVKDDELIFGTRKTKQTKHGEPLPINEVNHQFRHCYEYLLDQVDISDIKELDNYEKMTFFGESLQKHHIDYDSWTGKKPDINGDMPNFLGFDIYVEGSGFLPYDQMKEIYDKLGLETAPLVYRGSSDKIDWENFEWPQSEYRNKNKNADSEFDQKGLAEGIVVRNGQDRVKLVHPEFSESNVSFTTKPTEEEKAAREFVGKYVTRARVRKIAYKIRDEREKTQLEMNFMEELPLRVIEDIFDEEKTTVDRNDEETMANIRSNTSSKCSTILQELMN